MPNDIPETQFPHTARSGGTSCDTTSVPRKDLSGPLRAEEEGPFGEFEVDDNYGSERDSAYGDEVDSITTSIGESAQDYKFEHGRRYHAYQESKYALPNDDEEIARLELQHQIWQISLTGRLNLCPLPSPLRNVLDIGCGTGAWVIDFAEAHPETRVIGTDLSPIQPSAVPPNAEFLVDDFTAPWVFDHKFDHIHTRAITIGVRDWEKLVDEMWQNLEPGGSIEFQEYHLPWASDDGTVERCPKFAQWNEEIFRAANKAGVIPDAILRVPEILETRGFVSVETASTKWPIGPWAKGEREKRVGDLYLKDLSSALEGFSTRLLTKVLGWSHEDMTGLIQEVAVELRSRKMHAYLPMNFVWAQKPVEESAR